MRGILQSIGATEIADCTITKAKGDVGVDSGSGSSLDSTCAVESDNDDGWCDRYISRLPIDQQTCDCYDFCNGELVGCLANGEEPEKEYENCDFPRLGCRGDQTAPPGWSPSGAHTTSLYVSSLVVAVFGLAAQADMI